MSLETSKYVTSRNDVTPPKEVNPWREIEVHESNLLMALEYAFLMTKEIKKTEQLERVLVGEPVNGVYPLSVSVIKRKER